MSKKIKKVFCCMIALALICQMATFVVIAEPNTDDVFRLEENFDTYADGTAAEDIATADSGWTYVNKKSRTVVVQNKALYMSGHPSSDFESDVVSFMTTEKFTDGYIQTDVKLEMPPDSSKTYYTGSILARCVQYQKNEIGTRFAVTLKSNGTVRVVLELLVRDPNTNSGSYYGTVTGVSANSYVIPNFDINKTYNVKLQTIGNSVEVFLDGEKVIGCALDDSYAVASRIGSFGVANMARNSSDVTFDNLVAASLNTHTVSTVEGVETEKVRDLKTVSQMHSRTSYTAGETVTLNVTGTELTSSVLCVETESGTPVSVTEIVAGEKYTFVMPNENVSVTCKESNDDNDEELLRVEADFNGLTDGTTAESIATADSGWTYVNKKNRTAVIQNEALYMAGHPTSDFESDVVTFMTTEKFTDGYIQTDVKLEMPPDSSKTYYTGSILARCVQYQKNEIGTRFAVTLKSDGTVRVVLELLVRDPNTNSGSYYGTVTGVSANNYTIPNFDIDKTYNVKLQTIGNSVEFYLDGERVIACTLDNSYAVASRSGSFGVANMARNSTGVTYDNMVAVSLKNYSVSTAEGVETEKIRDLKTVATMRERTSYAAGETVVLEIAQADLDVSTLRVDTESGVSVSIAEIVAGHKYSFVMPTENVEVSCEKAQQSAGLPLFVDFNNHSAGVTGNNVLTSTAGWTATGGAKAVVTDDGKLSVPGAVTFLSKDTAHNGYIQADIQLVEPAEDGTYYTGNLYANYVTVGQRELRTRFAITKKADNCTVALQLIVYDRDTANSTDAVLYEKGPMITAYNMGGFDTNATYTVKLEVIGNFVQVSLNNSPVLSRTMNPDYQISERAGSFGFGGHTAEKSSVSAIFDNVQADRYEAYELAVDESMQGYISLDQYKYRDVDVESTVQYIRNSYIVGEFVLLYLNVVDGKIADGNNLMYTGDSGSTPITAHASETLYGFAMPAESITVTSVLIDAAGGTESGIYFAETFDEERLMIDNGWERDALIQNGALHFGTGSGSEILNVTNKIGASDWTDYSVEATIKVLEAKQKDRDMVAALCVRGSYEFGIYFPAGKTQGYFRLYDRVNGKTLVSGAGKAVAGESYTLKMEVKGTTLIGYVDGQEVFCITDDACSAGTIGLRLLRAQIECDDIIVKKI